MLTQVILVVAISYFTKPRTKEEVRINQQNDADTSDFGSRNKLLYKAENEGRGLYYSEKSKLQLRSSPFCLSVLRHSINWVVPLFFPLAWFRGLVSVRILYPTQKQCLIR